MKKFFTGLLLLPVLLQAQPKHLAELSATPISCNGRTDGRLQIALLDGVAPASVQCTRLPDIPAGAGTLDAGAPVFAVSNLSAGAYRVSITDANGVDTLMYAILTEPPPLSGALSVLTDFNGYGVSCAEASDGRLRADISGGTPYYVYAWSPGEHNQAVADSLYGGDYRLTVSDSRGCTLELSGTLTAPAPLSTQVAVSGEKCFGENSGAITLTAASGGVAPYLAALNDQGFSNQTAWTQVPAGPYFLVVEDANGCRHTDAVVLPVGFQFAFDAGPDTSLLTGDSLRLTLVADRPLDTVLWTPAASVWMPASDVALVFPLFTTTYHIIAVDQDGCQSLEELTVTLHRDRSVYAPNAFAPAAQNVDNQRFTLYGEAGLRAVAVLQIFDRFGKMIFEQRDFPLNDPASGWAGVVNGETGLPGVYVWQAVVAFTDGREEVYQGDVLLVR